MKEILSYFPDLSEHQIQQLQSLLPLYTLWNQKINVISRKDISNLYCHHILHSLVIGKFIQFAPGSRILDLGTGGGFPGIPLAILFPSVQFTLIDGTAKKIRVVKEIIQGLGLKNVFALAERAEEHKLKYDFIISRAVAAVHQLYIWSKPLIELESKNNMQNGLIILKGGDLSLEIASLPGILNPVLQSISMYFPLSYFDEKYLVYVPLQ